MRKGFAFMGKKMLKKEEDKVRKELLDLEKQELEAISKMEAYQKENFLEFFTLPPNKGPNPRQAEILNIWLDEEIKTVVFSGGNRTGKCATKLSTCDTPSGQITMGELYERGKQFDVYAWDGEKRIVARADAPFKKERLHKCFRLDMEDGSILEAADYHRILTSCGWRTVDELHRFFSSHQGSSLAPCPLSYDEDAPSLTETALERVPFFIVGDNLVKSITPIPSMQEVYDFYVPGYENYFGGGIVHHNTFLGVTLAISTAIGKYIWSGDRLWFPHNEPREIRYIGQGLHDHLEDVVIPAFHKLWPRARPVSVKKDKEGLETKWTDRKTGSVIHILSNTQPPKKQEGWYGDLVVFDEPPSRDIYLANTRGLTDREGKEIFCCTLIDEPWIHQEIVRKRMDDGRPDPSIYSVVADTYDNVGYGITKKGADQYKNKLRPEEIEARIHGQPAYMSGLILPMFSRNSTKHGGHLMPRFDIPSHWPVDIAIDVHPRKKQAILFCATDTHNFKYLCDEIWDNGNADWIADKIIKMVHKRKYRVNKIIIDPLSKGDGNNEYTMFETIENKLFAQGIILETATKDKDQGIIEIKEHLRGPNGMASCFVFNDLVRTIYEAEGWMWDEKTQKASKNDDDMMENLYRIMLLGTEYSSPIMDMYGDEPYESPSDSGRDPVTGY